MTRVAALGLLAAGWVATLWLAPFSDERVNDLYVYRVFAEPVLDGLVPYRDVFFEYPPLAAPAIALPGLAGIGEEAFRWAFAGWTFVLAGAVVLLCGALAARTGGDPRRALFAAALAPLLLGALVRTHFDLLPVALTLAALLLLCRGATRTGFAVLGLGVMAKGFPIVVAPVALAWLAARGRRREALAGAAALAAVVAAGVGLALAASPSRALDAVRYHLDRPLQIESLPATAAFALDAIGAGAETPVSSHRSDGLEHAAADALTALAGAALLLAVTAFAALAARRPAAARGAAPREAAAEPDARRLVLASLAAVAAFAALGKVLSPQFLIWIVPLGALAVAWREHAIAAAAAAAAVLTQLEFPARYFDLVAREPLPLALVAVRNLLLLALLGLCVKALSSPAPAAAGSTPPGRRRPSRSARRSATGRPAPSRSGPG